MSVRVLLLCFVMSGPASSPASAQGFAGLGAQVEGFTIPTPGYQFAFPADHGAHTDFRIEWWYLTANLKDADGVDYGVQWTLFRTALAPGDKAGWSSPQLWMGHAALTSGSEHFVAERLARGGIGQAGVTPAPFAAWIDDWEMTSEAQVGADVLSALSLGASGSGFSYELALKADKPIVLHGKNGYSVKSEQGQASRYYSQPFYTAAGSLKIGDRNIAVTGRAWLDREWSSQPLAGDQSGWDWFSLHFDSGDKMMAFRLRGAGPAFTSASWITAEGDVTPMGSGDLVLTPLDSAIVAGRRLPVAWRIDVPLRGVSVTTRALNKQAWMATSVPYWEGPVSVAGSHPGRGYLEMTGYE